MSEDFHYPNAVPSEQNTSVVDGEVLGADPASESLAQQALRVVLVDQSKDVREEARDRAEARLDKELNEGGRFIRFLNGIWKGNIAKDFYRQRYTSQELASIQEDGDLFAEESDDRRSRALHATIERFTSDYEKLIHTEAGERREKVAEDSPIAIGIKKLVFDAVERAHTSGKPLDPDILQEEKIRFINEYRKEHSKDSQITEQLGEGLLYADNVLHIAEAVYGAVEHGESLEHTVEGLEIIIGEARNGVRTEAHLSATEKIAQRFASTRVGSLLNEGTIGAATAIVGTVVRLGTQSSVGATTRALLPGAAAGAWAGLRENRRTKEERAQHARDMASGGTFDIENDKRRSAMEETRYTTILAGDLTRHLESVSRAEILDEQGNDALTLALDVLASIDARVTLSDTKQVDLIGYTSKADIGEERMLLDLALAQARSTIDARLTSEVRAAMALDQTVTIDDIIAKKSAFVAEVLTNGENGMNSKDVAFAKLKAKRVAKATAVGAATGITFGLASQEVFAAFEPSLHGLVDAARGEIPEANADGFVHQTTLDTLFNGDHIDASSTYDSYQTAPTGNVELSDDHTLVTNPDGTINIVDHNGKVAVHGLKIDGNGTFDQASLDAMKAAHMTVLDNSFDVSTQTTTTATVATEEFLKNHVAETTHVTRDFWYGNDTSGVSDENELRVYRGGNEATPGIVDGGFQYTVAGMTADGSWQGGEHVDWNQASASGNLFVAVSGTYDSQGNPFMIPIGPDGAVNIPADSPAGKFFANENNSVAFNGAYMEIVQTSGVDEDGTVHIRPLATLEGDQSVSEVTDTVTTNAVEHHANYIITTAGYDNDVIIETPPVVPIVSRRAMEPMTRKNNTESTLEMRNDYYGYGDREPTNRREFSPRIRDNPDADLDLREELEWFEETLANRDGEAYAVEMKKVVQSAVDLTDNTRRIKTIITMPVAAAFESQNIYSSLSLYAQQDPEQIENNLIILNTNWLDSAQADPEKRVRIQKTLSEIERAKRDFPNLRIASFTRQYNESEVDKTGGVIGYVANDLTNVALLALNEYGRLHTDEPLEDVGIIRHDADMEGLSRHYLRNVEKAIDSTKADIFNGVIRSGVRLQSRYPGFGIVTNFSQALNVAMTQHNMPWTVGINTVVRASTLAAVGGLGNRGEYSGAASDDLQIGRRITNARQSVEINNGVNNNGYGYISITNSTPVTGRKIVSQVTGLTVDSSAARLVPQYLLGRHFGEAWSDDVSGFSAGPGKYKGRDEFGAELMAAQPHDVLDDNNMFRFINTTFTEELANRGSDNPAIKIAVKEGSKKALAVFFGSVPGAYVIHGELGDRDVRFELTDVGKKFIRNRIRQEVGGRQSSYGRRKLRQLYGIPQPGRISVAVESSLVSPMR